MNPSPVYAVLNESDVHLCLSRDHLRTTQTGHLSPHDSGHISYLKFMQTNKLKLYIDKVMCILTVIN